MILNEAQFEANKDVKAFVRAFTASVKLSGADRFNPGKDILQVLKSVTKNSYSVYRRTSAKRDPNFESCEVGDYIYEPLISCTSSESFVDHFNTKEIKNLILYGDDILENRGCSVKDELKIIILPGAKTLSVDSFSSFPGQDEELAAGKFKVIKKTIGKQLNKSTGVPSTLVLDQVFDEDIFDIFEKYFYSQSTDYKFKKLEDDVENSFGDLILNWDSYSKRGPAKAEIERQSNKGIDILEPSYFMKMMSRRMYQNTCPQNVSEDDFIKECKKFKLKIKAGEKYGIKPFYPIAW